MPSHPHHYSAHRNHYSPAGVIRHFCHCDYCTGRQPTARHRETHTPQCIIPHGITDTWSWDTSDNQVAVHKRQITFNHPFRCARGFGASMVFGTAPLHGGRQYWEVEVYTVPHQESPTRRLVIGIATKTLPHIPTQAWGGMGARLHATGVSSHGTALTHNRTWPCMIKLHPHQIERLGMLYNSAHQTLTYFRNGMPIGLQFHDIDCEADQYYPMVSATVPGTTVKLTCTWRNTQTLQEMCRARILSALPASKAISQLDLPSALQRYLRTEWAAWDLMEYSNPRHKPTP